MHFRSQLINSTIVLLLLSLISYPIQAQKITIHKGVASIDGVPTVNIEENKVDDITTYEISNLSQNKLLTINEVLVEAYIDGPTLRYWKIYDSTKSDSFLVDYKYCTTDKKTMVFLQYNGIIKDGTFHPEALSQFKDRFDQQMGETFLEKNKLSFDNLVPRKVNTPVEVVNARGDGMHKNERYEISVGVSPNNKVIGYAEIVKKESNGKDSWHWNFYLPNHLLVATSMAETPEAIYFPLLKTIADDEKHNVDAHVNRNDLLKIAALLVEGGYL